MNKDSILRMILWIGPVVVQLSIAAAMIHRRLVKSFPVFFLYTIIVPSRDILLLFLRTLRAYSWVYWIGEIVSALLALMVMYEVLMHLIRPYPSLVRLGTSVLGITVLSATVIALAMLLGASDFGRPNPFINSIILLERSARFIQVGLLVGLILLVNRIGLTWKHYVAGIIAGFGIAAGLELLLTNLLSGLHLIGDNTFMLLKPASYDCAVLIWAFYFLFPQNKELRIERLPASNLSEWDELIGRYLGK